MVADDPLQLLAAMNLRLVWISDLGGDVLLLEEHGLALADVTLSHRQVADLLWESVCERWVS